MSYQLILDTIKMREKNRAWSLKDWELLIVYICEKELNVATSIQALDPKSPFYRPDKVKNFQKKIKKYKESN